MMRHVGAILACLCVFAAQAKVVFEAGEPVVIVQGPTWEKGGWGPYQFPTPFEQPDGSIVVSVHVSTDAFTHYADPPRRFLSRDRGRTWQEVDSAAYESRCGVVLPNGERVSFPTENSVRLTGWTFADYAHKTPLTDMTEAAPEGRFPVPDGVRADMFGGVAFAYRASRLAPSLRKASWRVMRTPAGSLESHDERAPVEWPFLTRVIHCSPHFRNPVLKAVCPRGTVRVGPDGALWLTSFTGEGHVDPATGQYSPYYAALLFRSTDNARSFRLHAQMEYPADGKAYPYASGGFSDSDVEWLPDGTMVWFMRSNWYSTTGEEWSPMYMTRSSDGGRTWTSPERFAPYGTLPRLRRLANGVTVVLYGRPGIFLSATDDPSGRAWSSPFELMTAGDRSALANPGAVKDPSAPTFHDYDGACGNPQLVTIGEDEVLVIYGDFYVPDAQGVKRKSILCRPVRIRRTDDVPHGLTTEWRTDPVGIDAARPRLSWKLPAGFARQTAYEVRATGWSSGRVASSEQIGVEWAGEPLLKGAQVKWRVRVWDGERVSGWSEAACFSVAMRTPSDWQAKWIGPAAATRPPIDMGRAKWIDSPVTNVFRKTFALDVAPTGVCELAFTTRDKFKVTLNGITVGDTYWEHFHDWSYLRTVDVGKQLRRGTNELVFAVTPPKGETPALLARLDAAGRRIVSDASWGREISGWVPKSRRELESPMFVKEFDVRADVRRATLYVTGVGFYEARLDGAKVGDKVLDPSLTDYTKRVLYSTYELGTLPKGRHELALLLGHGWYDQRTLSAWNFDNAPWRNFPRGIAQLELDYADGKRETVCTDASWRQVRSPVRYDDIREGEIVAPAASGEIGHVEVVPPPAGRLVAESLPPARVVRRLRPVSVRQTGDDEYVVTFPENISGWMRMRLRGVGAGHVVSFTYDERLAADGGPARTHDWREGVWGVQHDGMLRLIDMFFVTSLSYGVLPDHDAAFQRDRFITSGADEETYEPRFMFHGFRYVVIRGLGKRPDPADLEACVVSTDFPETGTFDCSDPVFNRLMANAARSYRANFTDGFPTDCPHREKNGWTGDASMASEMAQYVFDNTSGYEKWLTDLRDAQKPSGELPCIAPTSGWGYMWGNGPGWDSALPVVAWDLYLHKGDRNALAASEDAIRRLCDHTASAWTIGGLVRRGLGDHGGPKTNAVSRDFAVTCFALRANEIAARTADVFGHAAEGEPYRIRADALRKALRACCRASGVFDNGGQTAQGMAFEFGLVESNEWHAAAAALVDAFRQKDDHLDVGIYGMRFVPAALSRIGRTDLAYRAITQPTSPTPVDWLADGSTTLWESWKDNASRNHIMFGSFAGWAYAHLAGIRPLESGYRRVLLAPEPIAALSHVAASVETPYGRVASRWERRDGRVSYAFDVPSGTTAELRLPGQTPQTLQPGHHIR